VEHCNR